jgi:hypothetical protein
MNGSGLFTAVAGVPGLVPDQHLRPRQGLELREQGRLITLDRDHQMPSGDGEQLGMPGLGMQRVRDDQDVFE